MDKTILATQAVNALAGVIDMDAEQKAKAIQAWEAIFGELILHMIQLAEVKVQIPAGTVLIAAQAGVPNPAPIILTGGPGPVDGITG